MKKFLLFGLLLGSAVAVNAQGKSTAVMISTSPLSAGATWFNQIGSNLYFMVGRSTVAVYSSSGSYNLGRTSAAPDGFNGELEENYRAFASSQPIPVSATFVDVATITLTAGNWTIYGRGRLTLNSATVTRFLVAVSSFSNNTTTDHREAINQDEGPPPTTSYDANVLIAYPVLITSTKQYYLKCAATKSAGTPLAFGYIWAKRD